MRFRDTIQIADVEVFPIRASGGVSPKMALGTMPTRPALLVRINDRSGCFGWGEVWANFPPRANLHKAHIIDDVIAAHLKDFTYTDPREVLDALRAELSIFFLHVGQAQVFEHILAGIDAALWDLTLRHTGISFAAFMKLSEPSALSYATSINAEDLETLIPHHADLGQTYFKLKVGFAEHDSVEIVRRAAMLCPRGSRIMVDSNQSWTLAEAKSSLQAIEGFDPFFAEEALPADAPIAAWEELAKATRIPLAGGENIYSIDHFLTMTRAGMRVLQPDVAKWGGVSGALDLADAVPEDVLIWPHFMGTAIGQLAALSISAAIGQASVCEVDVNENALRTRLCGSVITIQDGKVALPSEPGLVRPPDIEILTEYLERVY
ncbi:MAG: mandelate racemase/muconate lactonizing enzyme family protein [Rhodobacteraceae bacterium]|nr:mandelate racemase/muconate lactonizing enzyme family protein [Paracoccaceae bacterium]